MRDADVTGQKNMWIESLDMRVVSLILGIYFSILQGSECIETFFSHGHLHSKTQHSWRSYHPR